MSTYPESKNIRFSQKDARQVFRYHLIPRSFMTVKNGKVEVNNAPYGTAYKIFKLIPIDVFVDGAWVPMNNSLEKLKSIYHEAVNPFITVKPMPETQKEETNSNHETEEENEKISTIVIKEDDNEDVVINDDELVEDIEEDDTSIEEDEPRVEVYQHHRNKKKSKFK